MSERKLSADEKLLTVTPTGWDSLQRFTDARIALGRAGRSLPTQPHLAFQLAHAQARDAVHLNFDALGVARDIQRLGLETLQLHSAANDRATYLQRPDLGRRLNEASMTTLQHRQAARATSADEDSDGYDVAFVIGDGLSALAIHQNAVALLDAILKRLKSDLTTTWHIAPIAIVEQARVAIGDEVGAALQARCVVVLIGERPGLSSPDSMGLYMTLHPQTGLTDANRNCISNVRSVGLSINAAADKLVHLLKAARQHQISGVALKDDSNDEQGENTADSAKIAKISTLFVSS